jgi:hypothetical protein
LNGPPFLAASQRQLDRPLRAIARRFEPAHHIDPDGIERLHVRGAASEEIAVLLTAGQVLAKHPGTLLNTPSASDILNTRMPQWPELEVGRCRALQIDCIRNSRRAEYLSLGRFR